MKKKTIILFLCLPALFLLLLIYGSLWSGKNLAEHSFNDISPKGYYRVEFWDASRLSFSTWSMEVPVFIRVYDNRRGNLLKETEILDIHSDAQIFWPSQDEKKILIGVSAEFPAEPEPE